MKHHRINKKFIRKENHAKTDREQEGKKDWKENGEKNWKVVKCGKEYVRSLIEIEEGYDIVKEKVKHRTDHGEWS